MGLLSIIKKQKIKDKEIRLLMLGLDNSGKTTITKRLLNQDISTISPTLGFQINTINYNDFNLNVWDIGGQTSLRTFWGNYFDQTDIVIWVIDCLSLERLNESYQELREKVILQDRLVGVYLIILINKIDLLDPELHEDIREQVAHTLDLPLQIPQTDKWTIQMVSGKSGKGLPNILDWIVTREY
ncbi:unnamed protein product [Debaryomyces fabryi]|nr:unnamed protein product [Debaryomyces fabryi]